MTLSTGGSGRVIAMNEPKDADTGQWLLWVDDQFKVIKMTVPGTNVEVIRD
jgi:hypothetical protein